MKLTKLELEKLAECDGVHATLASLFICDSCVILLKEVTS